MPCASFCAIPAMQYVLKLLRCLNELRKTTELNLPAGYVRLLRLNHIFISLVLIENEGTGNISSPRNLSVKNRFGLRFSRDPQISRAIFHNIRRDSIFPWYEVVAVKESESLFVRKRADKTRDISETDGAVEPREDSKGRRNRSLLPRGAGATSYHRIQDLIRNKRWRDIPSGGFFSPPREKKTY